MNPKQTYVREADKGRKEYFMNYSEYFASVKNEFSGTDVSDIKEHLAFQFNVIGEEGNGIFYVEVKEGKLYIEPYEYHDRDAIFIATADTFTAIIRGKMDPVWAFTTQKLKIEGDIEKALKLNDLLARK